MSTNDRQFADVLTETLRRHGVSQYRLVQLLGRGDDHSLVSRWCSGKRGVGYENVVAIADALKLDGDERARLFACARFWPDRWGMP